MKCFQGTQIALVGEGMFFIEEFHKCIQKEQLERYHVTTLDAILDSDSGHQWFKWSEGWTNGCQGMRIYLPHVHAHCNET